MLLFRVAPIQCICSGFAPGGTRWNAVVFLTAFLGLHLCLTPSAVAEEPAPSVEPQKAEYAIAGFRSGRERLRSGMFRARRTTTMKYPGRGMLTSHIDYFVAFDFDRDLQRFDYRVSGVEHPTSGKYIKNQEESLLATSDNEVVTRLTRGEYPHSNPVKPFDPRNLGTMDFLVQFSRIQPFDDFAPRSRKRSLRAAFLARLRTKTIKNWPVAGS